MLMIYLYCFPLSIKQFKKYLSSKYANINFLLEKENDGCLSFLDINIFREKGKLITNVYRKKAFIGIYTNSDSFISESYKTGLIKSLLVIPMLQFVFGFCEIHHEINILESILYKNSYPRDFFDKCRKEFLDRALTQKVVVSTAPKKELMIVSLQIRTRINCLMKNTPPPPHPHCNSRIVFQTKCNLINFFTFEDKIPVFYLLALFINLSAVDAMLPIMAKRSVVLKSE